MEKSNHSGGDKGELADKLLIVLFSVVLLLTCIWQCCQFSQSGLGVDEEDLEQRIESESLMSVKVKGVVQGVKILAGWRTDGVVVKDGVSYLVEDLEHGSRRGEYMRGEGSGYGAIVDFREQLAARDIGLVVMIVDGKGVSGHAGTERLVAELADHGLDVIHVRGESVDEYLKHDSHWRPEMMERHSKRLARMIEEKVDGFVRGDHVYEERVSEVRNKGDLVRSSSVNQTEETVRIRAVEGIKENPLPAKVLLLGDSYTNIFSAGEMGWGEAAGLGERLSYHLQSKCEVVAVNGNGAHASRAELMRSAGLLRGKRVVVWQFAARELGREGWERFLIPDLGDDLKQSSVVRFEYEEYEVVALPRWKKNSVYRSSLTEVLLKRRRDGEEVLVRMLLKKNGQFTRVEKFSVGGQVYLKIRDLEKQQPMRGMELFSLDRYDLEVYWGELK